MSGGDESRVIEGALGALSDWLELVRVHENERRARLAAEAIMRRNHATTVLMGILSAATLACLFWLSHR